jgi:hypothetical protein
MIVDIKLSTKEIAELSDFSEGRYDVKIRYDTEIHNVSWSRFLKDGREL